MEYLKFIELLKENSEESFADFQRKLIPTKQKILGVRTPVMRKIAKEYLGGLDELFSYPDEYFEVTFIKLAKLSRAPFSEFIKRVETSVALIDNWATCDCFKGIYISKHREEFLKILERIFQQNTEFTQRYVLVVLLTNYVSKEYFSTLENYLRRADTSYYYIRMAAAWLIAEILIKEPAFGVDLLRRKIVDNKTHNKAIQKAIESYRINKEQKECLRSLKIKN